MTPTNACRRLAQICSGLSLFDAGGRLVSGDTPTKEAFLHFSMYGERGDAGAVVHLHSSHATAVSIMRDIDPDDVMPPLTAYYVMRVGRLPLIPYFAPGDMALADAVKSFAGRHHAMLLANHRPVVAGTTLANAQYATEELEETAKLFLTLQHHARKSSLRSRSMTCVNASIYLEHFSHQERTGKSKCGSKREGWLCWSWPHGTRHGEEHRRKRTSFDGNRSPQPQTNRGSRCGAALRKPRRSRNWRPIRQMILLCLTTRKKVSNVIEGMMATLNTRDCHHRLLDHGDPTVTVRIAEALAGRQVQFADAPLSQYAEGNLGEGPLDCMVALTRQRLPISSPSFDSGGKNRAYRWDRRRPSHEAPRQLHLARHGGALC